jgi:hypothetical protein
MFQLKSRSCWALNKSKVGSGFKKNMPELLAGLCEIGSNSCAIAMQHILFFTIASAYSPSWGFLLSGGRRQGGTENVMLQSLDNGATWEKIALTLPGIGHCIV